MGVTRGAAAVRDLVAGPGGPRPREFLEAYARRKGFDEGLIDAMIASGELAMVDGSTKGARYGVPTKGRVGA